MPSDPRVHVHFMVAPAGRDWIDDLAAEHRLTRSEVIRCCIAVARAYPDELTRRLTAISQSR